MFKCLGLTATTAVLAFAGPAPAANYLYVENTNSVISALEVANDGSLTEIAGSPFNSNTTGPGQFGIAVDPKGPYLYTTGGESDNVAIFSIGADGALTSVSDTTDPGGSAGSTDFTANDKRLYIAMGGNQTIAAYDVGDKGAKLTAVAGSPFPVTCPGFCDPNPDQVVISGSYLYAIDPYGWYVSTFSIANNGALTELNSYATGWGPNDGVITKNGASLYVTNGASADVSGYSVAGGVLTPLTGSPFPAGNGPGGIAMTPNNKFVYVANYNDGTISGYSISSGGALVALAGSPFADGTSTSPEALVIDKAGKHLFVPNTGSLDVAVYDIDKKSGNLTQISGSPFKLNDSQGPIALALYEPK
ncbi:MAG TPA: beta-propeller fold lactonase family protein [Rhizomicrobium sp.]|nr:beta-propeller fold lactonase family protein [Rhizomicrobium sp.]